VIQELDDFDFRAVTAGIILFKVVPWVLSMVVLKYNPLWLD
jgi:hypothetical protein